MPLTSEQPHVTIPILGAQYLANPKEATAMLTTAEKEARTVALLQRVQTVGGMAMLIPEPSNRHNRNALKMIDDMLRGLPGEVYDDLGDLGKFLSRLYYLKVPRVAYYSILTLMLIRELTCEKLGITCLPLTADEYQNDDEIQDMEQMPATIGQVLRFGQTLCEQPVQRATVLMLANWLRDEYTQTHCQAAEELAQRNDLRQGLKDNE